MAPCTQSAASSPAVDFLRFAEGPLEALRTAAGVVAGVLGHALPSVLATVVKARARCVKDTHTRRHNVNRGETHPETDTVETHTETQREQRRDTQRQTAWRHTRRHNVNGGDTHGTPIKFLTVHFYLYPTIADRHAHTHTHTHTIYIYI
jgi:hypothetical protein